MEENVQEAQELDIKSQEAAQKEQLAKLVDERVQKLKNNEFSIHFYSPAINNPSGGVAVLVRLARALNDAGYNTKIYYEPKLDQKASFEASNKAKKRVDIFEKFYPNWVDFSIEDLEFIPLGNEKIKFKDGSESTPRSLKVEAEDFMIIPEGFPNIMKKTAQVSCKRIVLAQSWAFVLGGLQNGETWQHLGIHDVISVSDGITEFLDAFMPELAINQLKQGIDRKYFSPPEKQSEKFPIIGFTNGRDTVSQLKIINIIKGFYLAFPQFKWVKFIELSGLSREEFAERLKSCALVLYTDEIAGFGTLPLEAMACGTHVVGYITHGGKEYVNANGDNGFWATNGDLFSLIDLLGIAMKKWIDGDIDREAPQQRYEELLSNYTVDGEKERIIELIENYKKHRIDEFEAIKNQ